MTDLESILNSSNDGNRLQAEIGTTLLLQLDGVESLLKSFLVGMEPGAFIVARSPKPAGIDSKLFVGNQCLVRYLCGGTVFTFQSALLGKISHPFPLVFLSYPRVISRVELRKEPRLDCYIPARLQTSTDFLNGVILDISRSGCRFQCQVEAKGNPPVPVMAQKVEVIINMSGEDDSVRLEGVVRNVRQEAQSLCLGLSFECKDHVALGQLERCIRTLQEACPPRP